MLPYLGKMSQFKIFQKCTLCHKWVFIELHKFEHSISFLYRKIKKDVMVLKHMTIIFNYISFLFIYLTLSVLPKLSWVGNRYIPIIYKPWRHKIAAWTLNIWYYFYQRKLMGSSNSHNSLNVHLWQKMHS